MTCRCGVYCQDLGEQEGCRYMERANKFANEVFRAEPLLTEDSWRVTGSRGTIEAYRIGKEDALALAKRLNKLPPTR